MTITRSLNGKTWQYPSQDASEVELGDFLYGFVRLFKPLVCIETGCHNGDATKAIGAALRLNGVGHLFTCDVDSARVEATSQRTWSLPVSVTQESGIELADRTPDVDFSFIDSGHDRFAECQALQLSPRAYVVLHDAYATEYPSFDAVKSLGWTAMRIPTPLGVGLFEVIR